MELRRLAVLSSVLACFSTTAPAFAATIVVDNDFADCPQADFNSIQAAVVASQPGDKILVCPGTYLETVLVDKPDLRIEAQAAPGEVVLQGTAAQQYGFQLLNTSGVLLQGFWVQGYGQANIIIQGGSGNTLRKNITTASLVDGIEVIKSTGNVVEQNTSFANQGQRSDGIFVSESTGNLVRHNETFENGQFGINLFISGGNVVFGNRSHHNRGRGIQNTQSNGNVIENNYVFENGSLILPFPPIMGGGAGILIFQSTFVTVMSNRSESNRANGIALNGAGNNVVSNNRSESNRANGIALNGAADNLVEQNQVFGNTVDGIRLLNNSDRNTVQLNHVRRNGRDGIRVDDPLSADNTIERNVILQNTEHDAHDDSFGFGTSGTANFWINNKCETENRPGLCENPH